MNRLVFLFLSAFAFSAVAEEEVDPFGAEVELGVITTSGNTETSTFKGKVGVRQELEKWRMAYLLEGLYKKDEVAVVNPDTGDEENVGRTSAQKYFGSTQADYKLNAEHRGLFVFGSYEDDRFSGYEYQGTIAGGYSDRLFETENSHFDYSVGPGVSFSKVEDVVDDEGILIESESETNGVLRAAFEYLYQISENAKFTQTLASDLSVDTSKNSRTRSETAVTANINSTLALKVSYLLNQNTHVPSDKFHADSQSVVTLVLSF